MEKQIETPASSVVDKLTMLAGKVHTFESFGRAIISSALAEAVKAEVKGHEAAVTATISVITPQDATFGPDGETAGSGEAGVVPTTCATIVIAIGNSIHYYEVCY